MRLTEQWIEEVFSGRWCNAYIKKTDSYCRKESVLNPTTGRKSRCAGHGGLSTGPRSAAGKARIAEGRRRSGHMTSPDRKYLGLGFFTETKEDLRYMIRKKNNRQAYLRKKYGDETIEL